MKTFHGVSLQAAVLCSGLLAALAPAFLRADDGANFPAPIAASGREPLPMHGYFMVVLTVLFVIVFAITIYSMARHRKSDGHQPGRFAGPNGSVQWLWAMVPFAILLFVDYILISIHLAG